jgi:hypothetical protein
MKTERRDVLKRRVEGTGGLIDIWRCDWSSRSFWSLRKCGARGDVELSDIEGRLYGGTAAEKLRSKEADS